MLLIDDRATLDRLLGRALREEGWEVDHTVWGEGAFWLARSGGYELIVFDELLPGENLVSVCERLRGGAAEVRLLMLSEASGASACVVALDAGADGYIEKPCVLEELVARVHAIARRMQPLPARN